MANKMLAVSDFVDLLMWMTLLDVGRHHSDHLGAEQKEKEEEEGLYGLPDCMN